MEGTPRGHGGDMEGAWRGHEGDTEGTQRGHGGAQDPQTQRDGRCPSPQFAASPLPRQDAFQQPLLSPGLWGMPLAGVCRRVRVCAHVFTCVHVCSCVFTPVQAGVCSPV